MPAALTIVQRELARLPVHAKLGAVLFDRLGGVTVSVGGRRGDADRWSGSASGVTSVGRSASSARPTRSATTSSGRSIVEVAETAVGPAVATTVGPAGAGRFT